MTMMQQSSQQQQQKSCIEISIFLDEYPADTSWSIIDNNYYSTPSNNSNNSNNNNAVVATSTPYDAAMALTEQTTQNICLAAPGTYSFIITDAYNDGICCVWGEGRELYRNVIVVE